MNKNTDYARTLTVRATPRQAYEAVTSGFADWWTDPGATLSSLGDVATFRFPPNKTYWTFSPIRLEPFTAVEHECVDAHHLHDGLPDSVQTEWLGTVIRFEIEPAGDGAKIIFTHQGLKPALDCYEVCGAGWDFFFMDSLKAYLNEGQGKPHSR